MNLRRLPLGILLLALVGLAHAGAVLFAPSDPRAWERGFVYDDEAVILSNQQNLSDWSTVWDFCADPSVFTGAKGNAMFRPVAHASHVLDAHLWGWGPNAPPPRGWRLTNLLLHAATAGVLYLLLRRILGGWRLGDPFGTNRPSGASTAAFLGSLWFGLQPVNSEVVNYVTSRSESLAALFFLLALLAHLAAGEEGVSRGRRIGLVVASFLAALLSFGAKETGLLLPLVSGVLAFTTAPAALPVRERLSRSADGACVPWAALALYAVVRAESLGGPAEVAVAGRLVGGTMAAILLVHLIGRRDALWRAAEAVRGALLRRPLLWSGIVGALLLGGAALTPADPGPYPLLGGGRSLAGHLLTQARVAAASGLLVQFPVDLSPDHGVRVAAALDLPTAAALLGLAGAAGLAGFAALRGSRMALLAAVWTALAAAPSFLRPLNVIMNEHRLYLPATGLALAVGVGLLAVLTAAMRAGPRAAALAGTGVIGLFLAFSLVDDARARAWANPQRLWAKAVESSPDSWRARMHLGVEHYRRGERTYDAIRPGDEVGRVFGERAGRELLDAALAEFMASQRLHPGAFETRLNLGFLHLKRGDIAGREVPPDDPPAAPEEYREAIRWFTLAEESSPNSFRALYNRATAMAHGGMVPEATAEFERLAQEKSRTTMYAYPLADLYRRAGRYGDALAQCDLIERVKPEDAGIVALKRGEVFTQAGRFREGNEALLRAAALLGPQDPAPPLYMARLLVATGLPENLPMAGKLWEAALARGHRPAPKDRDVLRALAAGR